MRLLLDTKTLLWWHESPEKLPMAVLDALQAERNQVYMSIANAWEMQIKTQIGKLSLSKPWYAIIEEEQASNRFRLLEPTMAHIRQLDELPFHHRDPFDRLLIAQSMVEDLYLVSDDSKFQAYPVRLLWL